MPATSMPMSLNLKTLTEEEINRLVDLLFPVQRRIFEGSTPLEFKKRVLQNRAEESYLQVRLNRLGEVVGYCAVHFFHIRHKGRPVCVMRTQAGLLRDYRRGNSLTPFILRMVLAYRLRHPVRKMYFFAALIHPSSYLSFDKYARHLWPRPSHKLPAESWRFLQCCLAHFGYETLNEVKPQVVSVGWHTLEREIDRAQWQGSEKPAVRFFLHHNPGYIDGHGLVTLAPVSFSNVLTAMSRLVNDRLQRQLRARRQKRSCA